MNINKRLLILGIILALVGFGASFFINTFFTTPTDLIIAAREDIPAGTLLSEIPEDSFVQVPIQFPESSARKVLEGMVTPQELELMRQAGGVLIQDVNKYEPLLKAAVVSSENPAAMRIARLALDDPDMMIVTIPVNENVPESIRPGDRVDLAVAVVNVRDPIEFEEGAQSSMIIAQPVSSFTGVPVEALVALLAEAGYEILPPEGGETTLLPLEIEPPPTATPTPTTTPFPDVREPIAKVLVHGARVVNVRRETSLAALTAEGQASFTVGEIIGLDIIIPREAFEFVIMAANGGNLEIGMLSPLAEDLSDEPTMGASLQDLIDLFLEHREELAPSPTPTPTVPTPTATSTVVPPTITATATPTE